MSPEKALSRQMVFCDFDGTISERETLRALLMHFVPQAAGPVIEQIDAREISLREALPRLVGAIPSRLRDDIIAYTAKEPLRAGFGELLEYLAARAIPFVVLSSGLDFYIKAMLAPYLKRIHAIHALEVDTSGEYMRLNLEHAHPREAMPKAWVMRDYGARRNVAIGDAMSDLEMAEAADIVFARDRLLAWMRERGNAVHAYHTFHDVRRQLQDMESDVA